jgi:hypothetical protein
MHFMWGADAKGPWIGALLGAQSGPGVCTWLLEGTKLFPGDATFIGAVVCGTCGFLFGDAFFN